MEITAAIKALEQVPPGTPVRIVSDSEYVIKTMTRGWQRNKNQDLWDRLDSLVSTREVQWAWVKGHDGHPMNELADSLANGAARDVAHSKAPSQAEPAPGPGRARLTHIDDTGRARMVDVGHKDVTEREAVATGEVVMKPETLRKVRENTFEKGDVLGVARVAGVMAAKRTHELVPLCHPVPLHQVTVDLDATSHDDRVLVTATARANWKTGVEMEALTAVTVAALTVYDMCKSVDRGMQIEAVRLVRKTGGKSGDYIAD
jgi:cyclic pyranopterin phosphate synthase